MKGTVGYAPNSNNQKRNQVIYHVLYYIFMALGEKYLLYSY